MTDLVSITDPATGRVYRVHPSIAEHGEWLPTEKAELRSALPGMDAFERDVARISRHIHPTSSPAAAPEKAGVTHA